MDESLFAAIDMPIFIVIACLILIGLLGRKRQRKLSFLNCPQCGQEIRKQLGQFTKAPGLRKAAPCPNCGLSLQCTKWPHRVKVGFIILLGIPAAALVLADMMYPFFHSWRYLDDVYAELALRLFVVLPIGVWAANNFHRVEPAKDTDGL